jgi:hypothetical protein
VALVATLALAVVVAVTAAVGPASAAAPGSLVTAAQHAVDGSLTTAVEYSVDGGATWVSDVVAAPGSTIRVRQHFGTTLPATVTTTSVRTILPAGFTLVPGTTSVTTTLASGASGSVPVDESAVWTYRLRVSPAGPFGTFTGTYADASGLLEPGQVGWVDYSVVVPTVDGTYRQLVDIVGTLGQTRGAGDFGTVTVSSAGIPAVDPVVGGALAAAFAAVFLVAGWSSRRCGRKATSSR